MEYTLVPGFPGGVLYNTEIEGSEVRGGLIPRDKFCQVLPNSPLATFYEVPDGTWAYEAHQHLIPEEHVIHALSARAWCFAVRRGTPSDVRYNSTAICDALLQVGYDPENRMKVEEIVADYDAYDVYGVRSQLAIAASAFENDSPVKKIAVVPGTNETEDERRQAVLKELQPQNFEASKDTALRLKKMMRIFRRRHDVESSVLTEEIEAQILAEHATLFLGLQDFMTADKFQEELDKMMQDPRIKRAHTTYTKNPAICIKTKTLMLRCQNGVLRTLGKFVFEISAKNFALDVIRMHVPTTVHTSLESGQDTHIAMGLSVRRKPSNRYTTNLTLGNNEPRIIEMFATGQYAKGVKMILDCLTKFTVSMPGALVVDQWPILEEVESND